MKDRFAVSMFGQKRLSREGGIEIVVKELCTRMARDGCQVTCYNRSGHHVSGAEYDNKIEYDGIRQKFVPTIERKGLAAVSSSFFAALYSAFGKYDVVHIHAEGPAFFSWLPKMFRKRVVVTIHGIDWQREKWKSGFGSKFIRQGEKNAVKYADEIIVLSKGVQDYFRDTYGRETHFIPNGVNRPETREAGLITEKFGLTKDSYILFLGRLVPEKGIRYLVEAFKDVKTDKKLVIAGGSSDTDSFMMELKELAKDIWNRPWSEERRNDWERWLALAANSDVPMMKNAAKTIGKRLYGILNAMRHRVSNGNAEALNSKIRLLRIKARGYRNRERFKLGVMFHYGKLNMAF